MPAMKTWMPEDDALLREFAKSGMNELMAKMPNRSRGAIASRASKLGIVVAKVMKYDPSLSELEVKAWAWNNRILPFLEIRGSGCWEWNKSHSKGYGQIRLMCSGQKRIFSTHRIAWEVKHGRLLGSLVACHSCDNPKCNNPSHIFPGTMKDNTADMHSKNRGGGMFSKGHKAINQVRGNGIPHAKLNDRMVLEMRVIYDAGLLGYKLLARKFGVSHGIAHRAIKRRGWVHVKEATEDQRAEVLTEYLKTNPNAPKRAGKTISFQ